MKGKTLLCLVLVTSMLLSVFVIGSVGAELTTIGVEPVSVVDHGLVQNSTFTVNIMIRNVENLAAYEFKLRYDTSVLTTTSPTYAYSSDNVYAWSATHGAVQQYGTYGFNIPSGSTITKVEVGYEAYTAGNEKINITCSGNHGLSWATEQMSGTLPRSDPNTVTWFDFTGYTSWTLANLTDAEFRTRAKCVIVGDAALVYLDWIPVRVTYTAPPSTTNSPSSVPAGTWTSPTNAYSSDNAYASTSTVQEYGNYGFTIPSGSTITKVEVGYEAYTDGNEKINITCSWDNGVSWATEQTSGTLPGSDPNTVTWLNFTGATSWTPTLLSDANFRTRVKCVIVGDPAPVYLDLIPVKVTYTRSPSSVPANVWTNPTNAYSSDNSYASTSTDGAVQQYGTYGFNVPSGSTITSVEVGYEAYTDGDEKINITCSWDNGVSWATEQTSGTLPGSDPNTVTWLNFTGAIAWTPANLTDAKFRTRAKCVIVGDAAAVYLDWIPVKVTYTRSPSSVPAGTWTSPTNAYSSDDLYASTSTVQEYGTYGFNVPSGSTITKVEVGYEAYTDGDEKIGISCSWDGGTSWATEYTSATLPSSDPNSVTWVDFTTATTWTVDKLSDANFRSRARCVIVGTAALVYLDWIPVKVTYTAPPSTTNSPSSVPASIWISITYGGIFTAYQELGKAIHETEGWLHYAVMAAAGQPSFYGYGCGAVIRFAVDSLGESALDLYETKVGAPPSPADPLTPVPIPHKAIDGYFSNVHVWLHAEAGLISLSSPVCTNWHELFPTYSNRYHLTGWVDRQSSGQPGYGVLSRCDYINMTPISPSGPLKWYHVENVTATLKTNSTTPVAATTTQNSPSSVPASVWTNPTNAYSSDNAYASTSTNKSAQEYGTYGFTTIPSGSTIVKVEVGFEAYTAGNELINITCSWDGGTSWATGQAFGPLPTSDPNTVTWLDFTGATTWTVDKLSNVNFRSRARSLIVGAVAAVNLDWIPVKVTYDAGTTNSPSSVPANVWTSPTNAYADGGGYAYITSGTPSLSQVYGGYGFSISTGSTIDEVKVRYDAWSFGEAFNQQRVPTSDDSNTGGFTTSPLWSKVDETTANDTDYITGTTDTGGRATFGFTAFSVPAGSTIANLTIYYRHKDSSSANAGCSLKVRGTYYDNYGLVVSGTSWIASSYAFTTNPATGATWTVDDINGVGSNPLQKFGVSGTDFKPDVLFSMVYAQVNYITAYEQIRVDVSWDGGTNWSSKQTTDLTGTEATYWYDVTGATSWTPEKLNNTNFQTRVDAYKVGTAAEVRLDWIPVTVKVCLPMYIEAEAAASTNSPSSTPSGTWSNPTNAYSSNNAYASTSTDGAVQQYGTYGFSLPSGSTILKVEVGYEAYTAGDEKIRISCSWNNGTSWATEQMSGTLPGSDPNTVTWFDFTGAITWTPANLTDAKFRTRVKHVRVLTTSLVYLDWIPVRVYYDLRIQDFPWTSPQYTQWHEVYPTFSTRYNLTTWTDNSPSGLSVDDVIQLKNKVTGVTLSYRVYELSTNIKVEKLPAPPAIPEFPLETVLPIALIVAVIYVWWTDKHKRIIKPR